ncbi:putative aldehyde dehydrogenase [Seiridium cupressi]
MASSETAIERLQMAVVDGRTENVRYRQGQLQSLSAALRDDVEKIASALADDSKGSPKEVEVEYYLAMNTVRHFYDTLNFEMEYTREYQVVHGKDNAMRREGVGLVLIRPTNHTRFYSIIAPLAAAISAGNCVALELQDTVFPIDAALRQILPVALDFNTFCISEITKDSYIPETAVLVDQATETSPESLRNQILPSSTMRTIAIVDRGADVQLAAKSVLNARFSFGGTSPYAPDLVLVNEFVKQEFIEACSAHATPAYTKVSSLKANRDHSRKTLQALNDAKDKNQVSIFGSDGFKLIDVHTRSSPLTKLKVKGRYLIIASVSGLVDAIFTEQFEPLLAGYFFAGPAAAKYMAEQLHCHISCINRIPVQLLVGPAAPTAYDANLCYRYTKEMFSVSRPLFIEAPTEAFANAEELLADSNKTSASSLRRLAVKPLKPIGQPGNSHLSYFDTGFVIMASITFFGFLPVLGYSSWIIARKGHDIFLRWKY